MTAILCLFISKINSQISTTYVNSKWTTQSGSPDFADWSASALDPQKRLVVAGNTYFAPEGANVLLQKFDQNGATVWSAEWNNNNQTNDYGIDITIETDGDIYVAATSVLPGTTNYDYVVLKYNQNGVLQWEYIFDGPASDLDIPASISQGDNGHIYVGGGSVGIGTLVDFSLQKLDGDGNLIWEERYDYQGFYDSIVKVDYRSPYITVTGGSGDSWDSWDIATLRYFDNGTIVGERRLSANDTGLNQPFDMATDDIGNIYVAGFTEDPIAGDDGLIFKLDEDLNVLWTYEFDNLNQDEEFKGILLDDDDDILAIGSTAAAGASSELTVKLSASGQELWHQVITSPLSGGHYSGAKITRLGSEHYLLGTFSRNGEEDLYVRAIDENGDQLWKHYINVEGSNEQAHSMKIDDFGNILVAGYSQQPSGDSYVVAKIKPHTRYLSTAAMPDGVEIIAGNLIVRFFTEDMILNTIDDKGILASNLSSFVNNATLNEMMSETGFDWKDLMAYKIFPELTSQGYTSISRLGQEVQIPEMWSFLAIELPTGIDELGAMDDLNLGNAVRFSELNYVARQSLEPNDTEYTDGQDCLHDPEDLYENHIHIENVWDIETGDPNVKVGIIDDGFRWSHEDFGSGTWEGSKFIGGRDYTVSFQNDDEPWQELSEINEEEENHGTYMAGILGALSNNGKGIAGVAGGNVDDDSNTGASLLGYKIFHNAVPIAISTLEWASQAITKASWSTPLGDGVDVINMSVDIEPTTGDVYFIDWFDSQVQVSVEEEGYPQLKRGDMVLSAHGLITILKTLSITVNMELS